MELSIQMAAIVALSLATVCLAICAIRLRRKVNSLKQVLALTEYSHLLPRSEKRAIATAVARRWARKALWVKGDQKDLVNFYCLEAAKEISLIYNRSELLDFTVDDLKRSLDMLYSYCKKLRIATIRVNTALSVISVYRDTKDVRFFYHAGSAILNAAMMNWGWFAFRVTMLVLPQERILNAARVYFAGHLALTLYEGDPAVQQDYALPESLATHRFSSKDICRRCGIRKMAAQTLNSACFPTRDPLLSRLKGSIKRVTGTIGRSPGKLVRRIRRRRTAELSMGGKKGTAR